MGRKRRIMAGLVLFVVLAGGLAEAVPLGPQFTYQGQLKQAGLPVDGACDFQFSLWNDAVSAAPANQVGTTQTVLNVSVENGLFAVELNGGAEFGPSAFNGEARWLQSAVRCPAGSGVYSAMTVRQKVSPTPYALKVPGVDGHSLDAADGSPVDALIVDNNGNVGIGATQAGRKLQIGDNTVSNSEGMLRLASRSGTQGSNRIWDIGVPETDADSSGFGYSFVIDDTQSGSTPEFMVKFGSGHVGIGTITPASPLHVYKSSSSTAEAALRVDTRYMAGLFAMSSTLQIEKTSVDAYYSFGDAALHLNPNSSGNVFLAGGGGGVAIGTTTIPTGVKLAVDGKVLCEELEVQLSGDWPDFVFDENYPLMTLHELEQNIEEHGHLPGIPSAAQVAERGINVGQMQTQTLQKVEELTLYMIDMHKKLDALERDNQTLRERLSALEGGR